MAKAGDFVSRWKGPQGRGKIVGRSHCRTGPFAVRSPSEEGRGAALSDTHGELLAKRATSPPYPAPQSRSGGQNGLHEPGDILRRELNADRGPEGVETTQAQILVEIAQQR